MESFADELKKLNIYDKMNKNNNWCPQDNYEPLVEIRNVMPLNNY